MAWLAEHEPEPMANQDVQTTLQQLTEREAKAAGLTIKSQKPLPTDVAGTHYHRAKIQITVTGTEDVALPLARQAQHARPAPHRLANPHAAEQPGRHQDRLHRHHRAMVRPASPLVRRHEIPSFKFRFPPPRPRRRGCGGLAEKGTASAAIPACGPIPPSPPSPLRRKPGEAANPLDDYALIGVSPIGGTGYRVTLINKKKPEERITVDSDKPPKDGFKVLEVIRKAGDPLGTTVRMNSGSMTGTVSFDTKLLTLAAAPKAAAASRSRANRRSPASHPQPVDPNQPQRQPRPRVVPPPAPQAGAQASPPSPRPATRSEPQRPSRRGN